MRLISLHLENVFQYTDATVEFGPGVNGLTGPNGSGKSNLLKAILGALTNDWKSNYGAKEANISQYGEADCVSQVTLIATHGEVEFTVRRGLARCASYLRLSDGRMIEGDTKINQELTTLLGLSANALREFVFVMQGELFASCRETKNAVRKERMAQLFGLQWAETCFKAINDFVLGVVIPQPAVSSAELGAQWRQIRLQRNAARAVLQGMPDYSVYAPYQDVEFNVLWRVQQQRKLRAEIRQHTRELQQARQELEDLVARCQPLQEELQELDDWWQASEASVTAARAQAAAYALYTQAVENARQIQLRRTPLENTLAELSTPQPVPADLTGLTVAAQSAEAGRLQQVINTESDYLTRMQSAAGGECAYCRQPLGGDCELHVGDAQQKIAEATRELQTVQTRLQKLTAYAQAQAQRTQRITQLQTTLDRLRLPAVPPAVTWTVEDQEYLAAAEAALARRTALQRSPQLRELARCEQKRGQLAVLYQQQFRRFKRLQRLWSTRAEYRAALQLWQETAQARDAWLAQQAHVAAFDTQLAALHEQQRAAAAQERTTQALLTRRELFLQARALLHRDALPQKVSERNLQLISNEMNYLLAQRNADYSVTVDQELTLVANFQDGRVQPAPRLSGGQIVSLATTFWLAMNSTLARLGLLCLDEPTEYLDAESREALPGMLDRLREISATDGLQCVIATHEQALLPFFDHHISLAGVGQPQVTL